LLPKLSQSFYFSGQWSIFNLFRPRSGQADQKILPLTKAEGRRQKAGGDQNPVCKGDLYPTPKTFRQPWRDFKPNCFDKSKLEQDWLAKKRFFTLTIF
jgi:hypothetical protein